MVEYIRLAKLCQNALAQDRIRPKRENVKEVNGMLPLIAVTAANEAPKYIHTRGQHILMGVSIAAGTLLVAAVIVLIAGLYLKKKKLIVSFDHSSEIDEGTGLGNRYFLSRRYDELVKPDRRHEYVLICLFADSEKVERIYGRDEMLNFIMYSAEMVQHTLSVHDSFARIPGIGLMVLKRSTDDKALTVELTAMLKKIMEYRSEKMVLDHVRASAGIYRLKGDDDDIHECVFNAWQTAERAYIANEDYAFCSEELLAAFAEERKMRQEIARAFDEHEFITYIQFYVDTDRCKIVGGEALTRWHHPEKGLIPPLRFIPFMEKENIISRLDYYNLEEVCKFLDEIYAQGVKDFYVSINFSRRTFSAYDFVDRCIDIMSTHSFPVSMLAFEMTESVNVKNIEQATRNAARLKEIGIKLLLDDFGEGFASFYDLTEYPIDGLKIDKAIVDNIHTEKGNAILRGMTKMGHELNMTVIVEGVESDDQVKELKDIRCDIIQGFRFHRPIPVWDAKKTLLDSVKEAPAENGEGAGPETATTA